MLRFIAGCSINPANLGQLLLATETYQQGITANIMDELMTFDKMLRRQGPDSMSEVVATAQEQGKALEMTFQVFDERSEREALVPRVCEMVVLDLTRQAIFTSESLEIPFSGEIHIHTGQALTDKKVTYILPQNWTIERFGETGKDPEIG